MAMVPEVKTLLLDALKSGEYEKTTGRLARTIDDNDTVGYCCLGVLTQLASKAGICEPMTLGIPSGDIDDYDIWYAPGSNIMDDEWDYETCYASSKVLDWSGLNGLDMGALVEINDTSRTFEPVIEYIETNL